MTFGVQESLKSLQSPSAAYYRQIHTMAVFNQKLIRKVIILVLRPLRLGVLIPLVYTTIPDLISHNEC